MFAKKKLEMFEDQYGLHFSFRWLNAGTYAIFFFALIWNAFIAFWIFGAMSSGAPAFVLLFTTLHVLAGISMIYKVISDFFNRTNIDLIGDQLTIKHGPIPWFKGNKEVNVNDIEQFYVKEIQKQHDGKTTYNYGVWGIMRDGTRLDLTKGVMMESDYALVVEEKLEQYLDIKDRPVKGAYGNTKTKQSNYLDEIEEDLEKPLDLDELKDRPKPEREYRDNWSDEDFV